MAEITAEDLEAQFYDAYVADWDGEIDFYRERMKRSDLVRAHGALEVACGNGRVMRRLAQDGIDITGFDVAPEMLEDARNKSEGLPNVHWVHADMRTFELGRQFGAAIVPGHSFLFMTTPDEQVQCLEQIKKHLVDGGFLVLHLDNPEIGWFADLTGKRESACEVGSIRMHPLTGERFRASNEWFYDQSTQTATCQDKWEQLDADGNVVRTWLRAPKRFHCPFRFEIEHLLRRVGFDIEGVYGDFFGSELTAQSPNMIWAATKPAANTKEK